MASGERARGPARRDSGLLPPPPSFQRAPGVSHTGDSASTSVAAAAGGPLCSLPRPRAGARDLQMLLRRPREDVPSVSRRRARLNPPRINQNRWVAG